MSVHFADSNSKWVWLNKKGCILIWISLMFVLGGPKDYNIFCVHALVGCQTSLLNNRQSCSLSNSVFGPNKFIQYKDVSKCKTYILSVTLSNAQLELPVPAISKWLRVFSSQLLLIYHCFIFHIYIWRKTNCVTRTENSDCLSIAHSVHNRPRNNISKLKDLQHRIQKRFRQEYWAYIENNICPTRATQNDKEHGDKNKRFWTYIKHNKQDSIGVASLRDPETGRLKTDQTAKARILNKQFQSVFSPRMPSKLATFCADATKPCYPTLPEFTISTNGLLKLLATLKPNKAAGPDNIRPYVLHDLREEIAPALQAIFTWRYETGRLPEQWKEANVVPIFKKGFKHKASNYRPVSLTCVCSKMFEHIMVSQINRHLKEKVSTSLSNTASGRACHVTLSSLTLTMTSTQCFRPTSRSIALWWTSARPLTRCHMGGSSQSSIGTVYEAKTSTGLRTSWETAPNEWL